MDKEETPFDEANSWDTSSMGSREVERRKRQDEKWEQTEKKKPKNSTPKTPLASKRKEEKGCHEMRCNYRGIVA